MVYRRDVDGLRAVAILFVLLFHAGVGGLHGGFVGVDVFFVISGYVITAKLVGDIDAGQFSLRSFYARRIWRLMPAMAAMVAAVYIVALFVFLPPAMNDLSNSILATTLFSANFYFWKNSGYFEIGAQSRPLLHMWSLAVEEQFYFFIPVMIYVTKRYIPLFQKPLFVVAALSSMLLSIVLTDRAPTASFFLLPTRAWELLLGSLLVFMPPPAIPIRAIREALGFLAAGLLLLPAFLYDDTVPFPGAAALLPTMGAALAIYLGGAGACLITRLLSLRVFVGIGLISYSLYLVHWPIIVFVRSWQLRDPTGLEAWGILVLSFVLGWASWRFIEIPFRTGWKTWSVRTTFATAAAVTVLFAAFGIVGSATSGFKSRFPDFHEHKIERSAAGVWKEGRCFLMNQKASDWAGNECIRTNLGKENLLLWGDSFAAHYVPGLLSNENSLKYNVVQYTFAGCPPVLAYRSFARPGCADFNNRIFEIIKTYDIKTVVIAARWDQLRQRGISLLTDTVSRIEAAGPKVFVIGQSPMFAFDTETLRYRHAGNLTDDRASWFMTFDRTLNDRIKAAAAGASFINPLPVFCELDRCDYLRDGTLIFGDYGHFSARGSSVAVQDYFPGFLKQ